MLCLNLRIDARKLLEESHSDCDSGPSPGLPLEKVRPERYFQLDALLAGVRFLLDDVLKFDLSHDARPFSLHPFVVSRQTTELRKRLQCLLVAPTHGKPAWGVREEVDHAAENDSAHELQTEGKTKRDFAFKLSRAVGDPEGDDHSRHNADGFQHQQRTAKIGRRDL